MNMSQGQSSKTKANSSTSKIVVEVKHQVLSDRSARIAITMLTRKHRQLVLSYSIQISHLIETEVANIVGLANAA